MKKTFITLVFLSTTTGLTYAQDFMVDFYATKPKLVEGNAIVFDGIRVDGFDLTPENDAVKLKYVFNPETLNFELHPETGAVIYTGVGVFHEEHMVTDVDPPQPSYTVNVEAQTGKKKAVPAGEPLNAGSDEYQFTIAPGAPFVANFDLQIGHVMSFYFTKAKKDIMYRLVGPSMEIEGEIKAKEKMLLPPVRILMDGIYQLSVEPSNFEEKPVTFTLKSFNANNRLVEELTNEQSLRKVEFEQNTWDYAKYQVALNPGETLDVPASKNVAMKLVEKNSHIVTLADTGSALIYTATEANDYYLFIYSGVTSKSSIYNGQVLILAEGETRPKPGAKPKPKPDTPEEPQPTPDADGTDGANADAPEEPQPAPDADGTDANVDIPEEPQPTPPETNVNTTA